jgi:hypothetical protein
MNSTNQIEPSQYRSLDEIRLRKEILQGSIEKDDDKIRNLWNDLFHNPDITDSNPSKRVNGLINTGVGLLDGLILGWKLYRKFNGSRLFRKR